MRLGCRSFETTRAVASKKFSFHVSGEGKSLIYARGRRRRRFLPSSLLKLCAHCCRVSHSNDRTFSPQGQKGRKSFIGFLKILSLPLFPLRRFLTQIHIWYHYALQQWQQQKLTNFHTLLWDVPNTAYFIKLKFPKKKLLRDEKFLKDVNSLPLSLNYLKLKKILILNIICTIFARLRLLRTFKFPLSLQSV